MVPFVTCIDLFCGVGGLTHGLRRGGITVRAGIDVDPQCRFAYESNNATTFVAQDVRELSGRDLAPLFGPASLRVLAGCPPCQAFSSYSRPHRAKQCDHRDQRWELVGEFSRLVCELQPDYVLMENVPELLQHPVFKHLLQQLVGYTYRYGVVDCVAYGLPQTRKRLVLLASRSGPCEVLVPDQRPWMTVRDAIAHLPPLSAGATDPQDAIHTAAALNALNLRRIQASRPGGTWREWDEELRLACHRKQSGQTFPSVYGRMEWNKPAPTITTQCYGFGNGRFGHPDQDRAISLREAALLQGFPPNYQFCAPGQPISFSRIGRLIGNAVPVRLGEVLAQSLNAHMAQISDLPIGFT